MLAQRSWIVHCEFCDSEERADLNSFFRLDQFSDSKDAVLREKDGGKGGVCCFFASLPFPSAQLQGVTDKRMHE